MADAERQPNSNKQFWYPKLAEIFKRELDKRPQESIAGLQAAYAKFAGRGSAGNKTSVFNYLKGFRKPPTQFINWFGAWVRGTRTQDEIAELKSEIEEALKVRSAYPRAPRASLLSEFASGNRVLLYSSVDYYPFAGSESGFVETVFSRFFELADFKAEKTGNRRGYEPETGDIAFARFETAERMLRGFKFWRMPIRMSLGAICLDDHREQRGAIAQVLAGLSDRSTIPLQPIIVANDVGSMHCRKRLRFVTGIPDRPNLDAEELTSSLLKQTGGETIPVICTDEYTVLRVLGMLRQNNRTGCLVFPLNSRRSVRDETDPTRRELPQYYSSIAVSQDDPGFREFMQDALVQFLSTEIESTATAWYSLAKRLATEVSGFLRAQTLSDDRPEDPSRRRRDDAKHTAETWEWIFYTLTLDLDSIDSFTASSSLPWRPILLRARRRVQKDLGEHETLIPDLIAEAFRLDEPEDRLRKINQLCSAFDIQLPANERYLDQSELIDALRRELCGSAPPLPIKIDVYDPKLDNTTSRVASRAMRRFMRELQNMYDDTSETTASGHGGDAVDLLRTEIIDLQERKTRFGGESGCVLLARITTAEEDFIGCACLCNLTSQECELRYLWVHTYYRGRRVGHRIIERAKEVAKEHGCTSIRATLLKDVLKRATKTFIEMGFVDSGITREGRAVLKCEICNHENASSIEALADWEK